MAVNLLAAVTSLETALLGQEDRRRPQSVLVVVAAAHVGPNPQG